MDQKRLILVIISEQQGFWHASDRVGLWLELVKCFEQKRRLLGRIYYVGYLRTYHNHIGQQQFWEIMSVAQIRLSKEFYVKIMFLIIGDKFMSTFDLGFWTHFILIKKHICAVCFFLFLSKILFFFGVSETCFKGAQSTYHHTSDRFQKDVVLMSVNSQICEQTFSRIKCWGHSLNQSKRIRYLYGLNIAQKHYNLDIERQQREASVSKRRRNLSKEFDRLKHKRAERMELDTDHQKRIEKRISSKRSRSKNSEQRGAEDVRSNEVRGMETRMRKRQRLDRNVDN